MQALQHRVVFRGKHGGNQDNAVHRIMPQGIQRAHFAGVVVGGVDQQQLVVLIVQYPICRVRRVRSIWACILGR